MSELYWIHVLGNLHDVLGIFAIATGMASAICLVIYYAICSNKIEVDKYFKRFAKYIAPLMFGISVLGNTFIPDTKTLYIIYGVGGTLDYLKENETTKQIPDKAILALDKYLNEQLGDKDKKGDKDNARN